MFPVHTLTATPSFFTVIFSIQFFCLFLPLIVLVWFKVWYLLIKWNYVQEFPITDWFFLLEILLIFWAWFAFTFIYIFIYIERERESNFRWNPEKSWVIGLWVRKFKSFFFLLLNEWLNLCLIAHSWLNFNFLWAERLDLWIFLFDQFKHRNNRVPVVYVLSEYA